MGTFVQDVTYSHRFLRSRPGLTLAAALTLALGIGATTVVFSALHALLLRPLPLQEPDRLVVVNEWDPVRHTRYTACSTRMFLALRERNEVFTGITAWYQREANVGGLAEPLQVRALQTTEDFFAVAGLKLQLGRGFRADEARLGDPSDVVILGHRFWMEALGGDPAAVGRRVLVDDRPTEIIGVMPATEQWLAGADLVMPLPPYVTNALDRRILTALARLKPGETFESAQANLDTIAAGVRVEHRASVSDSEVWLQPLHDSVVDPSARAIIAVLSAAVALVLLIACANIANLLLARAVGRQREIAIHTALGAGRWRLVRRLLTESLMLAALGGVAGLLLAYWGVDAVRAFGAGRINRLDAIGVHQTTLLFAASLTILTGVVAGVVPAIQASRPNLTEALKEASGSGFGDPQRQAWRRGLVVAEVALALALLTAAGLLVRSVVRVSRVDPGFQTSERVAITVNLPRNRYEPDASVLHFWSQLLDRVRAMPGVVSAMGTSDRWLSDRRTIEFDAEGQPDGEVRVPAAFCRTVTPGYFKTMGIRLLDGREFADRDWFTFDGTAPGGSPCVVMVSETLATRQWPGGRAVGQRVRPVVGNARPLCTVIGVVTDVRQSSLSETPGPFLYLPEYQFAWTRLYLVVHVPDGIAPVLPAIREAVWSLDPSVPVNEVTPLDTMRAESLFVDRGVMLLVVIFAVVAVALAAVGVYGLLSYSVARRTQELGVRIALGAATPDVLRMIVREGLRLTLVGEAIGVPLALLFTVPLRRLLYRMSHADPVTYVAVASFLVVVALAACLVPAWRATRVNPASALRAE
jgi:putative ABC transport system permease protein